MNTEPEKKNIGTPYDDAFRTMLVDCIRLVIPVINEVFGKNYIGTEDIIRHPNEHFIIQQDDEEKRITDGNFTIRGTKDEIYLFDGWYDGDTKVSGNEEYTFTATEDMTLTAKYIAPKTIKVYLNGPIGGATVTGNTAARCNDTVSLTVEVNDGYHFIGWYKDEEKVSDNMTYTFTVTEDVVLVATFEKDAAAEEPTDPASPDHPNQDDGGNNTGNMNFFQKLIQMILNFFRRLFSR